MGRDLVRQNVLVEEARKGDLCLVGKLQAERAINKDVLRSMMMKV